MKTYNPGQKSTSGLETLCTFANVWSFSPCHLPTPLPTPAGKIDHDVGSSKVDQLIQKGFFVESGGDSEN